MAVDLRFRLLSIWKGGGVKDAKKDLSSFTTSADKAAKALKAFAGAAVVAGMAKLTKDAALLAARVETLGVVTAHMGTQMGMTETDVRGLEQSIMDQGITLQASRQIIAMMIQSNIDLSHSTDLARIAQNAAVIANTDSSDAAQRLTYVLQTGNVRMARTIGLNVDFAGASKELAASLGISTDALSEEETMQARVNAVKKAAVRIEGVYDKAMETTGKKITSLPRKIEALQLSFGKLFEGLLGEGVDAFGEILEAGTEFFDKVGYWLFKNEELVKNFEEQEQVIFETTGSYEEYRIEVDKLIESTGREHDAVQGLRPAYAKQRDELEGMTEAQHNMREASGLWLDMSGQMRQGMIDYAEATAGAIDGVKNLDAATGNLSESTLNTYIYQRLWAGAMADGTISLEEQKNAAELLISMGLNKMAEGFIYNARISRLSAAGVLEDIDTLKWALIDLANYAVVGIGFGGAPPPAWTPTVPTGKTAAKVGTAIPVGVTQHGGKLSGIDLVGEAGMEMIIGNVVIPANITRKLMGLGLVPGQGFQAGGRRGRQPYTPTPTRTIGGQAIPTSVFRGMLTSPETVWGGGGAGGTGAGGTVAAAEAVVTELAPLLEQVVPEAIEAAASATAIQIGAMQTAITAQAKQAREQNNLLQDIIMILRGLATDDGVAESILGGLQTVDLG